MSNIKKFPFKISDVPHLDPYKLNGLSRSIRSVLCQSRQYCEERHGSLREVQISLRLAQFLCSQTLSRVAEFVIILASLEYKRLRNGTIRFAMSVRLSVCLSLCPSRHTKDGFSWYFIFAIVNKIYRPNSNVVNL
jgi:hypothetical protein